MQNLNSSLGEIIHVTYARVTYARVTYVVCHYAFGDALFRTKKSFLVERPKCTVTSFVVERCFVVLEIISSSRIDLFCPLRSCPMG